MAKGTPSFLSQEEGERMKFRGMLLLSNYSSIKYMLNLQPDRLFVIYPHDKEGKTRALLPDICSPSKETITKCCAFVPVFAIVSIYTNKIIGDVYRDTCTRMIIMYFFSLLFSIHWNQQKHPKIKRDN